MKQNKFFSIGLALLLALSLLVGCSSSATAASSNASLPSSASPGISITDMMGRSATLPAPAKKVVALAAADCEILYALGAGEALVGRGEYCDFPAEILEVPSVESGSETNIEQIIALAPDIVIMGKMAQTEKHVDALENAGISVLISDAQNIEGVYTAIHMIGTALGKETAATALVDEMTAGFAAIAQMVTPKEPKETIYFEVSPLEYGLWAAGAGTFMDEIATLLGLENAFADIDGWQEVSEEQLLQRNPNHIVTTAMYFGEGTLPQDEIMGRNGWGSLDAVKNNRVYSVNGDEFTRPGPRLVLGAQALYDYIYAANTSASAGSTANAA